jgi:flavin reductase (DIM6/NTAB) family NADH-FMN oxidoreductase RutF
MPFDRNELRRVMGHFATGVTIVTTHDGEGRCYGLTANAVSSVSLDPPLILICVDKRAESHPAFALSQSFVVNILSDEQEELSRRFAVSGGEKFVGLACRSGGTGAPIIEGALAHVECRVIASHDAGDHTIHIGEVESADAGTGRPLLFFRGRYHRLHRDGQGH